MKDVSFLASFIFSSQPKCNTPYPGPLLPPTDDEAPFVVAGLTFFQQVVVAGGGSLETCKVRKNCLSLKSPGSESSRLLQNAFWLPGGHSLRVAATSSWFLSLAPLSLIQVTLELLALLSTAVQTLVCN